MSQGCCQCWLTVTLLVGLVDDALCWVYRPVSVRLCVPLFVRLPGRVLITRCWYGNLSVVVSSSAGPRPGVARPPAGPALPWPGWASCRHGGVLLWRFTFAPSVCPSLRPPVSHRALLCLPSPLCVCSRRGRYWSYSLLLLRSRAAAAGTPPPEPWR